MKRRAGGRAAYRIHLEYDGSRYSGWQRQGEGQTRAGIKTIAGSLERILTAESLTPLALVGSGRTDSGVHAMDQVAHLHLPADRAPSPARLRAILEAGLPSDIVVTRVSTCDPSFHARHDAVARTYLYCLALRRSAFVKPYVWWQRRPLDRHRVTEALACFQGFHDVGAFADLEPEDSPRCELQACTSREEGSLLVLRFTASHFLRRQVRRMVGAVVACGVGEVPLATLSKDLRQPTRDANLYWAERAAPSSGLFLARVRYSGDSSADPELPWFSLP